jgi:hypothetical protein
VPLPRLVGPTASPFLAPVKEASIKASASSSCPRACTFLGQNAQDPFQLALPYPLLEAAVAGLATVPLRMVMAKLPRECPAVLLHGRIKWIAVRLKRVLVQFPLIWWLSPSILPKIKDLGTPMNQFATERYAQKLSIRYVSGLRNQSFFSVNHFRKPCNHPNL